MNLNVNKICVFCGRKPTNKNKEHILPQWLIKLTGDPNRIVNLGFRNDEIIKFSWKNLTAPSCTKCNDRYSTFEEEVKIIIEKITSKELITGNEIIKILNWLDKVRIGLWLNYYFLEKNKACINPRLCIDERIENKDRFLQIHFFGSKTENKGLNAFGVDTFLFQFSPSFFALKINNVLLINGSSDFIISENCGFPYPKKIKSMKNGELFLSDWVYNKVTKMGICGMDLNKAVLTVYQPIQTGNKSSFFKDNDPYLILNCLDFENKVGNIFRVENNILKSINSLDKSLDYERVTGNDSKHIFEIVSQIYNLQIKAIERVNFKPENLFSEAIEVNKQYIDFCYECIKH
ncbi:hypothetical protein D1631_00485 [Chryseobacterium nematophagum]|uniref:HNH endonuclease n=1 Tax=Chryseobacterium nematophagum TaxID=2305228 RepID=A0A3M7TLG0_9FLAO|nr:hypothetical protein [Chryseobacterium nematophagum]RNA64014.1 hypothetical protein D1631_00485 [Chryseobacterium nematophagum]